MNVNKNELDQFFERLESLEADKKAIAEEMKESIESFAKNKELSKKSVQKAFKAYKEAKKDKDDFVLTDYEADVLIQTVFPEFASEPADA